MRTAAYPGSFDPPTVAHLAVAEAARDQLHADRVDLVLSEVALGKEGAHVAALADRLAVLRQVAATRPWLSAVVTPHRLLVDIARGYDAVVMGADKWAQVVDPSWYGSELARDEAVAALPEVAVAPRPGSPLPGGVLVLRLDEAHARVSSTAVRTGTHGWLLPEAARFAADTGAWVDAERYRRWRQEGC